MVRHGSSLRYAPHGVSRQLRHILRREGKTMVYIQAKKSFVYHVNHVSKRGQIYQKYYNISEGELLTFTQAIQTFDLTFQDIFRRYDFRIIQLNRRKTCKDVNNRRFISDECCSYNIIG